MTLICMCLIHSDSDLLGFCLLFRFEAISWYLPIANLGPFGEFDFFGRAHNWKVFSYLPPDGKPLNPNRNCIFNPKYVICADNEYYINYNKTSWAINLIVSSKLRRMHNKSFSTRSITTPDILHIAIIDFNPEENLYRASETARTRCADDTALSTETLIIFHLLIWK